MFLLSGDDTVLSFFDGDVYLFSQRSTIQTANEKEKVGGMQCVQCVLSPMVCTSFEIGVTALHSLRYESFGAMSTLVHNSEKNKSDLHPHSHFCSMTENREPRWAGMHEWKTTLKVTFAADLMMAHTGFPLAHVGSCSAIKCRLWLQNSCNQQQCQQQLL